MKRLYRKSMNYIKGDTQISTVVLEGPANEGQVKSPYWPFARQLDFDRNRGWLKSEFQYARETAIRELVGAYQQRMKETA